MHILTSLFSNRELHARRLFAGFTFLFLASAPSSADSPNVWGTIYHGCTASNCTRSGDRVLLNSVSANPSWFGPAFTDDQGVYAFYNLSDGPYVLHVYDEKSNEVWRQNVQSPQHVDPIQLR